MSQHRSSTALLLPDELHDSILYGGAEILMEQVGDERRSFLHILDETERQAKLRLIEDVRDPIRQLHERRLGELKHAREVLWSDGRLQPFLRSSNPAVWPAAATITKAVDVVRQLMICGAYTEAEMAAASELATSARVVAREATQPGLHLLRETTLPGQPAVYVARQWRKRFRDASATAVMPSQLSRKTEDTVAPTAWIVELTQSVFLVSDVLQLAIGSAPLLQLVRLLAPPSAADSADLKAGKHSVVKAKWRSFLGQHRQMIEYQSLFASVQEFGRMNGMDEAHVAAEVDEASQAGHMAQLRIGVYATVLHRHELYLLVSSHPRRLDGVTAAEKESFLRCSSEESWSTCVSAGLIRIVQTPTSDYSAAGLETILRQRFLSPALTGVPLNDCCSVRPPHPLSESLSLVSLQSRFNPFVILHGHRVDGGFEGDTAYLEGLQRTRDRTVETQMEEQMRRSNAEPSTAAESSGSYSATANTATAVRQSAVTAAGPISAASTGDAKRADFTRSLIEALTRGPMAKADIGRHPSMRAWTMLPNYEALLKSVLKERAEYKGRKYKLLE